MEIAGFENAENKIKTPQEELDFLRGEVFKREREMIERGEEVSRDTVVKNELSEHIVRKPDEVLHSDYSLKEKEVESIVLDLSPEAHDAKMGELINILQEKGILNTISVVDALKDPHIEDDFHRFLVQYIKAGFPMKGTNEKSPIFQALKMTLFEISLPNKRGDEEQKNIKELISKMEQFYSGMLSDHSDKTNADYFVLEIANANHSNEFVFYMAVPNVKAPLFEKQLLSIFSEAKIIEKKDDYNIFNENGDFCGSYAELATNEIFPLKTYEQFDYDPLNIVLNSFSKINKDGQGAAIQIIVHPQNDEKISFYKRVLKEMEKGLKFKDALKKADTSFGAAARGVFEDLFIGGGSKEKKEKEENKPKTLDQTAIDSIKLKVSSKFAKVNIRIITSSNTSEEANSLLFDIESSFNQFENTTGNKFRFKRLSGKELLKLSRDFSFRIFNDSQKINLNLKELTTVMHMPESELKGSTQLKQTKAGTAPAPLDLPESGLFLGTNIHRNIETKIFALPEDRLRHFYVIGQTGTGKTTLLKTMIRQDILNGEGVCMIDPHGSDIQEVLSYIPPERYEDVIYFDPGYTERPMGLNMLEYDRRFPEQKTFVVNEMLSIFNKLFDMKTAGGPMFEQYFRNAVMLVIEDPDTGCTLLDVSRVLADKSYRQLKLSNCKNPIVVQFWKEIAEKAGGEASLANIVPYITSKFDVFLSNEIMRPIVSQEKSSFNFREIMDNKKILLVNLAKGRLGDINSNLIGLIIVGKILMASLSRVDSFGADLPPFYLYIDEFQNVTTDSISTILSEARKYKLSLTVANQFIAQLDEKIKNSVFGNVGSIVSFRVSSEDAEYLEKQFAPVFTAKDLMNVDMHNSYVKLLSNGRPVVPFSMETNLPPRGTKILLDKIKELSYLKYGKERSLVEMEIMEKYKKPDIKPEPIKITV